MTRTNARALCIALAAAVLAWPPLPKPSIADDSVNGGLRPGNVVAEGGLSVTVPEPGESVWADALLAAGGDQLLGVETSPDGTVAVFHSAPQSFGDGSDGGETPLGACQDDGYALTGSKWTSRYEWYFKASSTPDGISNDDAEAALRRAADNITHANNDCSLSDTISATHTYQGTTSNGPNIGADGSCTSKDGQNVVSFGDLPSVYLGITCWWARHGSSTESDLKLNKFDYAWYINKPDNCSGVWGVESAATHEFGHVFGLASVSEAFHPQLTMSMVIGACQGSEKTLGLGDVDGLEALY